jgi:hypothetical protein
MRGQRGSHSIQASHRQGRIRFHTTFSGDVRSHHLTHHDVERVLRWPRLSDDLTARGDEQAAERVAVWLANPPMATADPSSVLVVTRERHNARHVQDAWRIYRGDLDLSRVRSAREAFLTFLGRYGLDLQIGNASRRLFTSCQVPMGPSGNAAPQLPSEAADVDVRTFQLLEVVPETAVIQVTIAYAVNETAVRSELGRHEPRDGRPSARERRMTLER